MIHYFFSPYADFLVNIPYILYELSKINCHYFWHDTDDYTITNKGYIWIYPNKPLLKNGICVLPEEATYDNLNCKGICSDFIVKYK